MLVVLCWVRERERERESRELTDQERSNYSVKWRSTEDDCFWLPQDSQRTELSLPRGDAVVVVEVKLKLKCEVGDGGNGGGSCSCRWCQIEGHSHYIHTTNAIMYTHPTSVCCAVWAQNAPLLRRSSSDISILPSQQH